MTQNIPQEPQKYSESPVFNQDTVPAALTRLHTTKDGTWGRLVMLDGALVYTLDGHAAQRVCAQSPATIYPTEPHFVTCNQPVRFKVEFLRIPKQVQQCVIVWTRSFPYWPLA